MTSAKPRTIDQVTLKQKLSGKLDASRSAAPKKRVADTYVTCGDDVVEAVAYFTACPIRREPTSASRIDVAGRIGDESWQNGIREIRMVQDIEKVRAQLHAHALGDFRVFINGKIPLFEWRALQRVASQISVVSRPRHAVGGCTRYSAIVGAGHGERTQVQKVIRVAIVVNNRSDQVRPIIAVAASAVIVLGVIIERKGRATL